MDSTTSTEKQDQNLKKLVRGEIEVPLPTYFALGKRDLPKLVSDKLKANQGELCPNLFALGRKESMKTSDGFKIVAIGGSHTSVVDKSALHEYTAVYTDEDIESAKDFKDADILITSDWPSEIQDGSKLSYAGPLCEGVKSIAELCTALKPRYHFSTSEAIFEREPFFHLGPPPNYITRFISLAPLNNQHKYKAMYAFSLEPSTAPPERLPEGTTATPFAPTKKRQLESEEVNGNGHRFATGSTYHDHDYHPRKRRRQPPPTTQECYFCLANNDVGKHMITSIGTESYMTVAKGPLSTRDTFANLGHPLHTLIIPIPHVPTSAAMDEASRASTLAEMQSYREALHSMIAVKSTEGEDGEAKLGAITWEISKGGGVHLHWQFLPVPVDLIKRGLVEAAFDVEAENLSYPRFAKAAADIAEVEQGDYFKVMIWSETMQKDIVLPLDKGFRFDLQFGRRVLGKLLQLESRTHWKDCVQDHDEEVADATAFLTMFQPYDFSARD